MRMKKTKATDSPKRRKGSVKGNLAAVAVVGACFAGPIVASQTVHKPPLRPAPSKYWTASGFKALGEQGYPDAKFVSSRNMPDQDGFFRRNLTFSFKSSSGKAEKVTVRCEGDDPSDYISPAVSQKCTAPPYFG